nr:desmoplakin [Neodiprion sertifer nucleopolyhedrovirus]
MADTNRQYHGIIVNNYTFGNLVQKVSELTAENARLRESSNDYIKAQRIINIALNQQNVDINSNLTDLVTKLISSKQTPRGCPICEIRHTRNETISDNMLLSTLQTDNTMIIEIREIDKIINTFYSGISIIVTQFIRDIQPINYDQNYSIEFKRFMIDMITKLSTLFTDHVTELNISGRFQKISSFVQNRIVFIQKMSVICNDILNVMNAVDLPQLPNCTIMFHSFIRYLQTYPKFASLNNEQYKAMDENNMKNLAFQINYLCTENNETSSMFDESTLREYDLFVTLTGRSDTDITIINEQFHNINSRLETYLTSTTYNRRVNTLDLMKTFLSQYDKIQTEYADLLTEIGVTDKSLSITESLSNLFNRNKILQSQIQNYEESQKNCNDIILKTYDVLQDINNIIGGDNVPKLTTTTTVIETVNSFSTLTYDESDNTTLFIVAQHVRLNLTTYRDDVNNYFNITGNFTLISSLTVIKTKMGEYENKKSIDKTYRNNEWIQFCDIIDCNAPSIKEGDFQSLAVAIREKINNIQYDNKILVEDKIDLSRKYRDTANKILPITNENIDEVKNTVDKNITDTIVRLSSKRQTRRDMNMPSHLLTIINEFSDMYDEVIKAQELENQRLNEQYRQIKNELDEHRRTNETHLNIINLQHKEQQNKYENIIADLENENRQLAITNSNHTAEYMENEITSQKEISRLNSFIEQNIKEIDALKSFIVKNNETNVDFNEILSKTKNVIKREREIEIADIDEATAKHVKTEIPIDEREMDKKSKKSAYMSLKRDKKSKIVVAKNTR